MDREVMKMDEKWLKMDENDDVNDEKCSFLRVFFEVYVWRHLSELRPGPKLPVNAGCRAPRARALGRAAGTARQLGRAAALQPRRDEETLRIAFNYRLCIACYCILYHFIAFK